MDKVIKSESFRCPQCDFSNTEESKLHEHLVEHGEVVPCICPYCNYAAFGIFPLDLQSSIKKEETQIMASDETDSLDMATSNNNEMLECADAERKPNIFFQAAQDNDSRKNEDTPFECQHCDFRTAKISSLRHHLQTHLNKRKHKCPHCEYQTSHTTYFRDHMNMHANKKPYKCFICNFKTSFVAALYSHIRRHRRKEKNSCPHCDYKTIHPTVLARHMKLHAESKPYQCEICKFRFKEKRFLKLHMEKHSKRKHVCPHCSMVFSWKRSLQSHLFLHFEVKPFHCTQCTFETFHTRNLKVHLKTHNRPLLKCAECDFRADNKKALSQHAISHVKIELYEGLPFM